MLLLVFASPAWAAGEGAKTERGLAAVYAQKLVGHRTTSGERLDREHLTAAHRSLPFGTIIGVTKRENGRKARVRVNDRGPHRRSILLDLSPAAAVALGIGRRATVPSSCALPKDRDARRLTRINRPACVTCMCFHSC